MALSKADFNNINVTPAASKKLKWNASANGFETGDLGGSMVLLSTQTASSSATISFTSGIDDTYKEYVFKFIDIHPAGNDSELAYRTAQDLAQGTGAAHLTQGIGTDNDQSASGQLMLFAPSSTTFVKHFIARTNTYSADDYNYTTFVAGYCNVTAAIDGVQFIMSSGNIDAGVIKMYGVGPKQ